MLLASEQPGSGDRMQLGLKDSNTMPCLSPDDGKLSFEEFQNYFADGVLSSAELRELFSSIDEHLTE